jgi:hypothetical protein
MGGGGSGGSYQIDLSKLTAAAGERIREIVEKGVKVLFVCEAEDLKSLKSHLARSTVFNVEDYSILESSNADDFRQKLDSYSVVVAFTNEARKFDFLDSVADIVLGKKKQGIHVKATPAASIPPKISGYRWPSLSWDKLEAMFEE